MKDWKRKQDSMRPREIPKTDIETHMKLFFGSSSQFSRLQRGTTGITQTSSPSTGSGRWAKAWRRVSGRLGVPLTVPRWIYPKFHLGQGQGTPLTIQGTGGHTQSLTGSLTGMRLEGLSSSKTKHRQTSKMKESQNVFKCRANKQNLQPHGAIPSKPYN